MSVLLLGNLGKWQCLDKYFLLVSEKLGYRDLLPLFNDYGHGGGIRLEFRIIDD